MQKGNFIRSNSIMEDAHIMVIVTHKSRFVYLFRFTIILRTKYAIMATTTGTTTKYTIDISENESFDI